MSKVNWCDVLGWGPAHLQELRFTGYTYLKEGKYDVARVFFEALIVVEPDNAFDYRILGAIFLLLGDFLKALDYLDKALRLDPIHVGAKLNRAKALLFLGKTKEGLVAAEEIVNCDDKEVANDAEALLLAYK